ncbi:MAG: hypothetical protein AAB879_01485, partial [Patescibacteria group bacterium]
MPHSQEGAAAPKKKVILSPEVEQDIERLHAETLGRPLRSGREAVGRLREAEETVTTGKVTSLKEALRALTEEGPAPTFESANPDLTAEEFEQTFTLDRAGVDIKSHNAKRIAHTNKILGQRKASDIWDTVTDKNMDGIKVFGLTPERATEYVHAVAELVDQEKGLIKIRSLNKHFGVPEAYDPIMGSGASRPTAARSLARERVADPEMFGARTAMPTQERIADRVEQPRITHVPKTENAPETKRENIENTLLQHYGVSPSQVYFNLGNVDPTASRMMQKDPKYREWVTELRKTTGELMKEEARHRESKLRKPRPPLDEEAAMKEGLQRIFAKEEQLTEEKFFEEGDRMTREAEEQRANLIELNEELHEEVAKLQLEQPTPRATARIRTLARQIDATEKKLRGEFEEQPEEKRKPSLGERITGWWKNMKSRYSPAPREKTSTPEISEIPLVVVGDEVAPASAEARLMQPEPAPVVPQIHEEVTLVVPVAPPSRERARQEVRTLPPTDKEIEGRALLEFQRTLDNPHVALRREQALQYLVNDFGSRAQQGKTFSDYPGWNAKDFNRAAHYLQVAINEWKRKPLIKKESVTEENPKLIKRKRVVDVVQMP